VSTLLDNAMKYGSAPISVAGERTGGTIALLVHDDGVGIDPYHQTRVFDPFYRIDVNMRSGVGGAGLGLFSARKLVEAMRGMIRVRSGGGGAGTTFVVELPAAPAKRDGASDESDDDGSGPNLRLVVGT
jgi:signal transduction histidine kinase